MGLALYPSFEKNISGFNPVTALNGKPVAQAIGQLDKICTDLVEKPLSGFHSESLEEAFEKIGEPVPEDLPPQPIAWSEPSDGIKTISALIVYLNSNPKQVSNAQLVIADLEGFLKALIKASEHGTRFRLRYDV